MVAEWLIAGNLARNHHGNMAGARGQHPVSSLDGVEISTSILVIYIPFLDLLSELLFSFPCFLRALQFKAMLVHGESHGLETNTTLVTS